VTGRKRAANGQNFLRHRATARALVRAAGLKPDDLVYDLGAGSGALTDALLETGARIVAVECDGNLVRRLRTRFAGRAVTVIEADVKAVPLAPPFKVVANIPYNQTAAIMRRLFFDGPYPQFAQIVMQREAAEKYAGIGRLTAVSLMLLPWFEMAIAGLLAPTEFVPRPRVESAVLQVRPRPRPLLAADEREAWQAFVRYALGRSKADARLTFRNLFSNLQWRRLSADLGIAPGARLDALELAQWLALYRFARNFVPADKARRAFG
jgi:16S rRNA A1518/A1519 N6-dimethyltransferase RsmA/KsgA/DIM1 with predicted DNA glycosylase/AP lyase activity